MIWKPLREALGVVIFMIGFGFFLKWVFETYRHWWWLAS